MTSPNTDYNDPAFRRSGIGGSDAAMAVGVSPWGGPYTVYAEKTGQSAPLIETEKMQWGNLLEDPIAREAGKRLGRMVVRDNRTIRHPEFPFMFAHVDRWTRLKGTPQRLLEVKATSAYRANEFGEEGSDQVPAEWHVQADHYMAVTNADVCDMAVLIGGQRLGLFRIERDPELEEELIEAELDLWQRIQRREPPPYDGSDAASAALAARFPAETGVILTADETMEEWARQWRAARAQGEASAKAMLIARQNLESLLIAGEARRARGDGWSLTVSQVEGAHIVNWRKLAETLKPDLAPADLEAFTDQRAGYPSFRFKEG